MSLAVRGNLRVAAAARTSYGQALQLGYRTGTITGMLTDGLGLMGGTLIFMMYGDKAYEILLGFGFGGTLLALFMRVGGGIYTKAADVGADLVGKVEAGIPEDDPRNAATIADNVGDNVGDCAGMAADIFESYEVTIVAAMILGFASLRPQGRDLPAAGAGDRRRRVDHQHLHRQGRGRQHERRGPALGPSRLHHRLDHQRRRLLRSRGRLPAVRRQVHPRVSPGPRRLRERPLARVHRRTRARSRSTSRRPTTASKVARARRSASPTGTTASSARPPRPPTASGSPDYPADKTILGSRLPIWASLGISGMDLRPAWTCLIGILLALALNKVTSYYTHTQYEPVKSLAKSCQTGHATNIIQGFAVGYESTVVAVVVIAVAILLSVLIYAGATPIFVAYGVAMCGIGMLTLTGNTISMDVFGPVADNSNGIGEMGYDREEMGEENYKRARQILADLDAVGNTTKAETKGIAIGSAVIAAVSLFASFIAVIAVGSEDKIGEMTVGQYMTQASRLSISDPTVFIGALIGGAVPFLFSSMLIRAVGRAAFLIVKECRAQFRDPEIWPAPRRPTTAESSTSARPPRRAS